MSPTRGAAEQWTIRVDRDPDALLTELARAGPVALWLDGGGCDAAWDAGRLVAIAPRVLVEARPAGAEDALRSVGRVERRIERRRAGGGVAETGVALLVAYEAFDPPGAARGRGLPTIVAIEVDRSLRLSRSAGAVYSARIATPPGSELAPSRAPDAAGGGPPPASLVGTARTSLPREAYLRAVRRVQHHIREGDIYQANLCQVLCGPYRGDPLGAFTRLRSSSPAPRSAFLRTPRCAVVSASPETFLRLLPPDRIQTWPIKGTRPRGATPPEDRAARRSLAASAKDRAELLMIVDLERNDLGRVCRTGSVHVPELATLRTFATVHHLVACVEGRLRARTGIAGMLRATFPGGSITGAPKRRARQILSDLERTERGYFTGSLFWFGDDGSMDSSILIRTAVFSASGFFVGAGGGIVVDSDPEQEWLESIHKARAITEALGFAPEEAV